jgi:hypothetical protein
MYHSLIYKDMTGNYIRIAGIVGNHKQANLLNLDITKLIPLAGHGSCSIPNKPRCYGYR